MLVLFARFSSHDSGEMNVIERKIENIVSKCYFAFGILLKLYNVWLICLCFMFSCHSTHSCLRNCEVTTFYFLISLQLDTLILTC